MRRLYRILLVLVTPLLSVLLRVPFLAGRAGLYGHDPYLHMYLTNRWLDLSTWSVTDLAAEVPHLDYNAWPGAHILAGSLSSVGGVEVLEVMTWLPLLFLFLMDLAIVLVLLRYSNLAIALLGGVLFGLLDFMFFQTHWYIPELLGLTFIAFLFLNELAVRRELLSLLLLVAALLTHHLSFLIALIFWVVLSSGRPDRNQLVMVVLLAVSTVLFWDHALENTGSFPDIQNQLGGVHPAVVAVVLMASLMALKWFATAYVERVLPVPEGASILDHLSARWKATGTLTVVLAIVAGVLIVLALYLSSVARMAGLGFQPAKLLILAGGFLFLAYGPIERDTFRVLCAFALVTFLFILNPLLFDFIPLTIRFLEFMYIPGIILLAVGVLHLCLRRPERASTVVMALLLVCPVLYVDDVIRYADDGSQRFVYSSGDLEFSETIGVTTEYNAVIASPPGMASMVLGMSERRTWTHAITLALEDGDYLNSIDDLEEAKAFGPVYLLHSSDPLRYMVEGDDQVSQQEIDDLEASLEPLSDRFELVMDDGVHTLYRFT